LHVVGPFVDKCSANCRTFFDVRSLIINSLFDNAVDFDVFKFAMSPQPNSSGRAISA
jgi:hypothetical protein